MDRHRPVVDADLALRGRIHPRHSCAREVAECDRLSCRGEVGLPGTPGPGKEVRGRQARVAEGLPARGRSGVVRGLLGSVTDRVLHTADVPVLIVRAETAPTSIGAAVPINSIICPVDGSERSESGVAHASAFARNFDSTVVIMHSVGGAADAMMFAFTPEAPGAGMTSDQIHAGINKEIEEAELYVDGLSAALKSAGVKVETRVERGGAREQIVGLTEQLNGSMIVMNTRGNTGARRWAFGSVADGVIRTAPVPTLVVRAE